MPSEDETPDETTDETSVAVIVNPALSRFEITFGDRLAGFTVWEERPEGWAFVHTVIEPDLEGRGLASQLVRVAMDTLAERGTTVIAECPYVRAWLDKHPDHPVTRG